VNRKKKTNKQKDKGEGKSYSSFIAEKSMDIFSKFFL
jgi:hypothetical protein